MVGHLFTTVLTAARPVHADADEVASSTTALGSVRAHVSGAKGEPDRLGQQVVSATILTDPGLPLRRGDLLTDPATGFQWQVLTVVMRRGLGLDYQACESRVVSGVVVEP